MDADTRPVLPTPAPRDDRDVRFAWVCLAAAPVAFILAFVVGEGIATAMSVEEGTTPPVWVAVLVLLAAVAVFAVPVALAWRFANRARSRGDDRGRVPAIVLSVLALVFVGVNVLSGILALFVQD
jgi:hypothetical protein